MTKPDLHIAQLTPLTAADSMPDPTLITHDVVAEVFQDAFRRRVGRGVDKISLANLADALDINPRTVKAWRDGDTLPQIMGLMRVCAYFGPAFTSEILFPAGLGGVETLVPVQADPQGTARGLVAMAHDILERLADTRFCHRDRAAVGPKLLELSRALEAQANAMTRGQNT
ncbi:MAG: hypothetical protein V3U60_16605 [Gammaproteobacteria bacterium]